MHRFRATVAGLVLALALAVPVAAADIAETLTVLPTTTLTGVPTTIAYGSGLAGVSKESSSFTMTATTNATTGLTIRWSATDLTGPGTIAATNRYLAMTNVGTCSSVGALSGYSTAPGKAYTGPAGTAQSIVTSAAAGSCVVQNVKLTVAIPAAATAGAYTGTTTLTAVENP